MYVLGVERASQINSTTLVPINVHLNKLLEKLKFAIKIVTPKNWRGGGECQ
jgi:hypothetical protein